MWQETKHGLYKQFNFDNFKQAWGFMEQVAALAEQYQHHPRWENEWRVVQIWLITHEGGAKVTDKDHQLAAAIDSLLEQGTQAAALADAYPAEVKLFADGGSRGNPGPSASGFVVLDMEDTLLVEEGVYLGVTTNNMAEYTALKLGLASCQKMGVSKVQIYMDSLLVVNQMNGIFKIRNRELYPIHDACQQVIKQFAQHSLQHVPREFNKLADKAVNRALDDHLVENEKQA